MGGESREGSGLNEGRGPRADAPPPRQSLPAGGKASGRRRRFQNKEMRRGAPGTGVERKAEEVRLRPPGCPLPLQPARGNSPHPQPGLRRLRVRGEEAVLGRCFPVHFCRAESGRRAPGSAAAHAAPALYLLCPGGWAGGRVGRSIRKRAERSEHAPQLSDARPERAAAAPPSRSLSPAGKETGRSAGAERGNLNRPSSPGAAAPLRPHHRLGVHPLEVERTPGQWVWQTHLCDYTRHGSARTHPTGARAQHSRLQTASPGH